MDLWPDDYFAHSSLRACSFSGRLFGPPITPDQLVFAHPFIPTLDGCSCFGDHDLIERGRRLARRPSPQEILPEPPQVSDAFLKRLSVLDFLFELLDEAVHETARFQHAGNPLVNDRFYLVPDRFK